MKRAHILGLVILFLFGALVARTATAQTPLSDDLSEELYGADELAENPNQVAVESTFGYYVNMPHINFSDMAYENTRKKWEDLYSDSLKKPFVDGAQIALYWSSIEPKPLRFNWVDLDKMVKKILDDGKSFGISIVAGEHTPEWIYAKNVGRNVFKVDWLTRREKNTDKETCKEIVVPTPWDNMYLRRYRIVLLSLAHHLKNVQIEGHPPGAAYAALRHIKVSGINASTAEIQMPNSNQWSNCETDKTAADRQWQAAGYTREKLFYAWYRLARYTGDVFYDKALGVDVLPKDPLPTIGDSPGDAPMIEEMLARIIKIYGKRLTVQWDALSNRAPASIVTEAGNNGASIGWQMNNFLGHKRDKEGKSLGLASGCIYPVWDVRACDTEDDYAAILLNGINHGANYIEIQAPDVVNGNYDAAFGSTRACIPLVDGQTCPNM